MGPEMDWAHITQNMETAQESQTPQPLVMGTKKRRYELSPDILRSNQYAFDLFHKGMNAHMGPLTTYNTGIERSYQMENMNQIHLENQAAYIVEEPMETLDLEQVQKAKEAGQNMPPPSP